MEGGKVGGLGGPMGSDGSYTQQQLLLAPPTASMYYESREKAVTEVEKTIGELGTLQPNQQSFTTHVFNTSYQRTFTTHLINILYQ